MSLSFFEISMQSLRGISGKIVFLLDLKGKNFGSFSAIDMHMALGLCVNKVDITYMLPTRRQGPASVFSIALRVHECTLIPGWLLIVPKI
ncbi:hypothetical protein [Dyadobacter psychrophilus]|uniref:Uncharacterized protein n=1 Tax=Dyadobacter psychrophilus TaxID=651661 RepID=A0A1T5HD99_9BACT|nr:hypothetical protein [Dyadobacter psychrophilus]SKC18559.1 hypothetical protein SAMN05660293_05332 [Dyadobacter psychrophilus]